MAYASDDSTIISCRMEDGTSASITANIVDGDNHYYLNADGGSEPVFSSSIGANSSETVSLSKCIGHTMIVSLESGSPYIQSLAVRKTKNHVVEVIKMTDRFPPKWLYQKPHLIILVSQTHGLGEYGNKKYVIYSKTINSKIPTVTYSNRLPSLDKYRVFTLH
jgi:hypothetical protein